MGGNCVFLELTALLDFLNSGQSKNPCSNLEGSPSAFELSRGSHGGKFHLASFLAHPLLGGSLGGGLGKVTPTKAIA